MFRNYLKITLAVMKRRKFYTFISLFGISVTLAILVVLTAFYEHVFSSEYPEVNRDRSLYTSMLEEEDTVQHSMRRGPMSLNFINQFIKTLETPEKVAVASTPSTINTYGNGKRLKVYYKFTDPVFWEVTSFDFIEGKPYTQQDIDNNEQVVVIDHQTRDDYFGKGVSAIGKKFDINGQLLTVVGVVRGCPITRVLVSANVYMPYHLHKRDPGNLSYNDIFIAIVLGKDKAALPAIQAEYAEAVKRIPVQPVGDFKPNRLNSRMSPYFEAMVEDTFFNDNQGQMRTRFYLFATLFALLFMSLPAVNLVNINISRMLERSSEIGVRKAFGASSRTLVHQFVIENVLLTLIGGALALALSGAFIFWFNRSGLIPHADLAINWTVVAMAVVLSLIFGLMSGVAPAWRMSRLPVVEALKG